jgi:hypothetical protein
VLTYDESAHGDVEDGAATFCHQACNGKDADCRQSAQGMCVVPVGEQPATQFVASLRSRSPGASPLRWQDVRASGGQQPAYDTPSPNTAQPPSPWTGMLDSLRRSPPKVLQFVSLCRLAETMLLLGVVLPQPGMQSTHKAQRHLAICQHHEEQHGEAKLADWFRSKYVR